jgi:hypothetical protein
LLSSTTIAGQTAAMISSLGTSSPACPTSTPRTSSAREPIGIGEDAVLVALGQAAPIETKAVELENIVHGERVPPCALHARPRLRKF